MLALKARWVRLAAMATASVAACSSSDDARKQSYPPLETVAVLVDAKRVYPAGSGVVHVERYDNWVIVARQDLGIRTWDVSTAPPRVVGEPIPIDDSLLDLRVSGPYLLAMIGSYGSGSRVYDLRKPSSPAIDDATGQVVVRDWVVSHVST